MPELRPWRLLGVATGEDLSGPLSGNVSISFSLIHNWPWNLPSVLTLSIPLYLWQISLVSLATPLSAGAVSKHKMKNPRRNPSLAGFMVEQVADRSCLLLLYFRFGFLGGLSPPPPKARVGYHDVLSWTLSAWVPSHEAKGPKLIRPLIVSSIFMQKEYELRGQSIFICLAMEGWIIRARRFKRIASFPCSGFLKQRKTGLVH